MSHEKFRRQILHETARLLLTEQEHEVGRAKIRAARKLFKGWVKPRDMPTDREVRTELQRLSAPPLESPAPEADRFAHYRRLLEPLERVMQRRGPHPEGDALYHSLQVYELAHDERPFDEEFLLAALLHDVGKGIDALQPNEAALRALAGTIPERTDWFIRNLPDAQRQFEGTLGARARRRIAQADDGEDLLLLAHCDREGRLAGAEVRGLDDVLAELRELAGQ